MISTAREPVKTVRCLKLIVAVLLPATIFCTDMEATMDVSGNACQPVFEVLQNKRIYFAHMSVGYNIVAGIEALAREKGVELNIRETGSDGIAVSEPGLYHGRIGKNGNPTLKIKMFEEISTHDLMKQPVDAVMMKLCYADIVKTTDVDALFEAYSKAVTGIRENNPQLKIIHITVPLMAHQSNIKERIRNLVSGDVGNIKRNLFNGKLVEAYAKIDPVFDLASIEASRASGKSCGFRHKGKFYMSMNPVYTKDGGHLNESTRKMVACRFLQFLTETLH